MAAKMSSEKIAMVTLAVSLATLAIVLMLVQSIKKGPGMMGPAVGDDAAAVPSTPTGGTVRMTYDQAIETYGDYRIQFSNCNGAPGALNVAKGSTVMLDNRDAKAHTIKLGTKTYSIGAYGFAIANVGSTAGEQNVTCDGGGASKVKVQ